MIHQMHGTLLPATTGFPWTYRAWHKDQWTATRAPCDWCGEHPPRLWAYALESTYGPENHWHDDLWYCGEACFRAYGHAMAPGTPPPAPAPAPSKEPDSLLWQLACWGGWIYILSRVFGG